MAAPAPTVYTPGYSFTAWQSANPIEPPPGGALDSQFTSISASISSVILALGDIRRADGIIANGTVKPESLHASTVALLGTGFNPVGNWTTVTAYVKGDLVQGPTYGATYVCTTSHTSGVFNTDLAAGKWLCLAPFSPGQRASVPAALVSDAGKVLAATGADTYVWATLLGVPGFRNRLINADFKVNQRGFVSGGSLASGAYGHDRWKAGSGGCTYTFTADSPAAALTITAGTLMQVVEGAALEGGTFGLSWLGTAQARVNGGAYAASPITVSGLTAGTDATIEFGTGTLLTPQFEPSQATYYERRPPALERLLCERYARLVQLHAAGYAAALGDKVRVPVHWPAMRAVPSVTVVAAGTAVNVSSSDLEAITAYGARFSITAAGSGALHTIDRTLLLSAEL